MKTLNRKIIANVLLIAMFFVCTPTISMAEVLDDSNQMKLLSPRLTYIVDAMADLEITGTTATVDCWVRGSYSTATKAKIIVELQLESGTDNWIAHATWVDTQNDYEAAVYETKGVKTGQNYRVKVTATVWEGSQSETVTFFTDEVTA